LSARVVASAIGSNIYSLF